MKRSGQNLTGKAMHPRILVIDDSKGARDHYRRLFESKAKVSTLARVSFDIQDEKAWQRELRKVIEDEEPDLVILDLALDRANPFEGIIILRFLIANNLAKVFVCSKYVPESHSVEQLKEWGACDACSKYPSPSAERFLQYVR